MQPATADSPVKKFNTTVFDFLADLKKLFDDNDKDILMMETACDLTKVNVRFVLTPFQKYISNNPIFVKNIMEMNVDYFLSYDYGQLLKVNTFEDDYNTKLIHKFREATRLHRHDKQTVASIFNWFKVMMYHAYCDEGKDPKQAMDAACTTTTTA